MPIRIGETEEAELRQRARGERRRRSTDRLPEEAKAAKRPVALQLELHIAPVMQQDAYGPSHDAERHDRLEEADRARSSPGANADHRADHYDEERERDRLGYRVEVPQQGQLDEESDGPKQDQREQNLAQRAVARVIVGGDADRAGAHSAGRTVAETRIVPVYHQLGRIRPRRVT